MEENAELLTRREAAKYFRLSLPTIDRFIREGQIPIIRLGHSVRFRKSSLEKMVGSSAEHQPESQNINQVMDEPHRELLLARIALMEAQMRERRAVINIMSRVLLPAKLKEE
jgi:excisionase family DNA binding protein